MLSNIPFVFTSAPSSPLELDANMPSYEDSMLCYGIAGQDCSLFTAATPMELQPSPASDFVFSFELPSPLGTMMPVTETASTTDYFATVAKRSHWNWAKLELSEPLTKTSRFNWSEMDLSTGESAFENFAASHEDAYPSLLDTGSEGYEDAYPSLLDTGSEGYYNEFNLNCSVCSMVPYGAFCSSCNQIQTTRATVLATPPAAAWPIVDRLGGWEGHKKPEEELLQNLDMELFEQINVPHELDEWGRRVYNDCGHRIIYCVDEDGNTVMGYEAWYPSSVTGDYEEPDDWRAGRQPEDPAVGMEVEHPEHDECGRGILDSADSDGDSVIDGYEEPETWHTVTKDDMSMVDFEEQRLAEFLAAQDEELPGFQSDRKRIAAWIATSSDDDDGDSWITTSSDDDGDSSVSDYES